MTLDLTDRELAFVAVSLAAEALRLAVTDSRPREDLLTIRDLLRKIDDGMRAQQQQEGG